MSPFALIHAINTGVLPIFSKSLADDNLLSARALYHAPYVEELLVASMGLHISSGLLSRLIHPSRGKLSTIAISGYALTIPLLGHVTLNRIVPGILDIDITASLVGHHLRRHKALWILYLSLIGLGTHHMVSGLSRFLGLSQRWSKRAYLVGLGIWGGGLLAVSRQFENPYKEGQYELIGKYLFS